MKQMELVVTIHRAKTVDKSAAERARFRRSAAKWLRKNGWTVAWYFILTIAGVALYRTGADYALKQRGYYAVGGEALALLLPVLWYVVYTTIRDWVREIKDRL
jgi:hypothetical protein